MATSLRELLASTPLSGGNAPYVEALYEQFLADPQSVDARWRDYFQHLQDGLKLRDGAAAEQIHSTVQAGIVQARQRAPAGRGSPGTLSTDCRRQAGRGFAPGPDLRQSRPPDRQARSAGPAEARAPARARARLLRAHRGGSRHGIPHRLASERAQQDAEAARMLAQLEYAYCGTIGAEFAHVSDTEERLWLQDQFLKGRLKGKLTTDEQKNLLWQLSAAEGLERYLHTKYVGQKRFSLEGGDSLIPLMDDLIQRGGEQGVEECVIGMAHRGRLNVLVNLLGKSPSVLFNEFEGKYDTAHMQGSGDVKYHKGFSSDLRTPGGNVHVALAFNPSHLEVVNPVVEGSVRARQERRGDIEGHARAAHPHPRRRGLRGPGRGHGDAAAVAGARVLHRRQRARHRQQPGGFHHLRSARCALDDVLLGRRQDARDADFPREWRRSGSRGVRHAPRARVSPAFPQGRGHRSRLLSPPRPQRGRRTIGHAADDVPGRSASIRPRASSTPTSSSRRA